MKKFLFTLASIVALGFAANAANVPTFAFSAEEVEMGAGETMELKIVLTGIDSYMKACDWTFNMVDPEGNLMTEKVKLQYLQKYGARTRYQFFGKTGISADNENTFSTSDGAHATNATMTTTGVYKLIMSNAASNICFYNDEATPADIALFTIEVEQGWEAEYAEFKLIGGKCVMMDAEGEAGTEMDVAPMTLKIKNKDYVAPQPAQPAPVPTFVEENGQVAAVCEGHTVVLMLEGNEVANPYDLPAQTDQVQVLNFSAYTVANADESGNSATVTYQVIIPAKEPDPVLDPAMAPSVASNITGYETATVVITNNQEGGTVHYVIYNADGTVYAEGEFTGDSKAIEVEGAGTYSVSAYCTADGYDPSAPTTGSFTIYEGQVPVTGIDELINGKNVASVRYFNMAGQEMQEANGMTIIVTTYTDGTSSAVKVMK